MTTIIKASLASDFLALVPQLVGLEPTDCIVFVAFRGNRTCGAMRFSLPPDGDRSLHKRVATTLVGMLSKLEAVDAVVPVVYTSDSFERADGAPHSGFVREVTARFRFSGFLVRDALCVAADGWGSYLDGEGSAAPRPLAEIAASSVLESVPAEARRSITAVDSMAALPKVDLATSERVGRLVRKLCALIEAAGGAGSFLAGHPAEACAFDRSPRQHWDFATLEAFDDLPAALERILETGVGGLEPSAAAFVIAVSRAPALRDVVMLQWAFERPLGDLVLFDAAQFARGAPADALDTAPLMLGRGPRPDPRRVEEAIEVLKAITARSPRHNRPPLLCMLAWLYWALGLSSVAHLFVVESERINPSYGLAEVLRTMLDRAMLPEWAFASE